MERLVVANDALRAAQRSLLSALSPDLSRRTACCVRHGRCRFYADGDSYVPQSGTPGGADYSFAARALRRGGAELGDCCSVALSSLNDLFFVAECYFGDNFLRAAGADSSTGAAGSNA